jgi:hypothetical protein
MGCGASKNAGSGRANQVQSEGKSRDVQIPLAGGSRMNGSSTIDSGMKSGTFGNQNFILSNSGSLTQFYTVESAKIGQGSYGSVTRGTNKATGAVRAIKTISKSQVKNIERFRQEIAIMKQLDHPNIIKLFETFLTGLSSLVI